MSTDLTDMFISLAVTATGSPTKFGVKCTRGTKREHLVDFRTRQCTCGHWQHFQAPCPEVIACGIATGEYTADQGNFLKKIFHPSVLCKTLRDIRIREQVVPVPIPEEPVTLVNDMELLIEGGVDPQVITREQMSVHRRSQGTPGTDEYFPAKTPVVPSFWNFETAFRG